MRTEAEIKEAKEEAAIEALCAALYGSGPAAETDSDRPVPENNAAVRATIRLYRDAVARSLAMRGLRDADIEEAVQRWMLAVACRLRSFKWTSSLKRWVFRVARNVAHEVRRDASRWATLHLQGTGLEELARETTELSASLRTSVRAELRGLLDRLSEDERELLVLKGYAKLSWKEIVGELLARPPDGAATNLEPADRDLELRRAWNTLQIKTSGFKLASSHPGQPPHAAAVWCFLREGLGVKDAEVAFEVWHALAARGPSDPVHAWRTACEAWNHRSRDAHPDVTGDERRTARAVLAALTAKPARLPKLLLDVLGVTPHGSDRQLLLLMPCSTLDPAEVCEVLGEPLDEIVMRLQGLERRAEGVAGVDKESQRLRQKYSRLMGALEAMLRDRGIGARGRRVRRPPDPDAGVG